MGSTGSEAGWVGYSCPIVYSYSATLCPALLLFCLLTFYCGNIKNWPVTLLLLILYLFVGSDFKSRSRRMKGTGGRFMTNWAAHLSPVVWRK